MASGDSTVFQFPLLEVQEIVPQLRKLGNILVDENDFKKPDPRKWSKIFPQILESLTGVSFENILQNSLNVTSLEYPELYEESLPLLILSLALSRVLASLGIKNFSIQDIQEPKSSRLARIGSAVVNFILFREQRIDVFRGFKEDNERSAKQFEHVVKMNDELKMKVNSLKSARAEQEPEFMKVQQEMQGLTITMNEMEKVKMSKQKSISEIKTAVAERNAATEKIKVLILKTKEEMDKLSQKIVQSPERVREDQENMKQQLVNMKCGMEKKWELLEEMRQRLETVVQGTTTVDKVLKLLLELETDLVKENEISSEINQIVERCQEQRTRLTRLHAKKDQLQQIMSGRLEKRDKLSLQHQNKLQSLAASINSLKEQKELYRQRFDSDEAHKSDIKKQEQQIIDSINEENRILEKKKEMAMHLYRQILEKIDQNHKDLGSGWEALMVVMQKVLQQVEIPDK